MNKDEQNIAPIFYPDWLLNKDGYLIGFNFEGFLFVVTTVVSKD
jgi:hypothetical protein